MFRSFTSLLLLLGICYGGYLYINPYWLRDVAPNFAMTLTVGKQNYYFPLRYIEPRYPSGMYVLGNEAVIWMNLDPETYKIMPQDSAIDENDKIDAALTSDINPETKRVSAEFQDLQKHPDGFDDKKYGLKWRHEKNVDDYLDKVTRITCQDKNCLLYKTLKPDLRLIISFKETHLSEWKKMVDNISASLDHARNQPNAMTQLQNILPAPIKQLLAAPKLEKKKAD